MVSVVADSATPRQVVQECSKPSAVRIRVAARAAHVVERCVRAMDLARTIPSEHTVH